MAVRSCRTYRPRLDLLERRIVLTSLSLGTTITAAITSGTPDTYQFSVLSSERVTASVQPTTLVADTRLSLLRQDGTVLVQSDSQLLTSQAASLSQLLPVGTYGLRVEVIGPAASGSFSLTTSAVPALLPIEQMPVTTSFQPAVVAGDFTSNGIVDLVRSVGNSVSVLLGNGDGTFCAGQTFPVGGYVNSMVAGDFGNGKLDLATASTGSISVLLGNGDGTFQASKTYPGGGQAIIAADFNGDGKLDLATANGGGVSVFLGNGDGTFQAAKTFTAGPDPYALAAGDLNGDGKLDLVVADHGTEAVSVLLGNGDGTFQAPQLINLPSTPGSVVLGDFTGNGHLDIATAAISTGNLSDNTVSVLLGNGNGTFQAPQTYRVGNDPGLTTASLVAQDLAGNGRLDLVVANGGDGTVSVLMGNGDGTFQPEQAYATGAQGAGAVAVADFNGDGRLDLAITSGSFNASTVSILLGNGDGSFQSPASAAVGNRPVSVAAGDFTGDGRLDLAVADQFDNAVAVLLSNGDGTFQAPQFYRVGVFPSAVVVGDFNGDGRLDLAVATDSGISVLLGDGDGTFQPAVTYAGVDGSNGLAVGDLTGNGHEALVAAGTGLTVLLGNGDGTFQAPKSGPFLLYSPASPVLGDFDGDGKLDVAVTYVASGGAVGSVAVLHGNGDGTFRAPDPNKDVYFTGYFNFMAPTLVAGDFNGDGKIDLATSSAVLLGNGDGTFQVKINPLTEFLGVSAVAAGDFNDDGKLDLAIATKFSSSVTLLLGNGNGTFQTGPTYSVGQELSLLAADVNGDGRVDLVAVSKLSNTLSVLLGSDGTLVPSNNVAPPSRSMPVTDLDGTGVQDVLIVDSAGNILYRRGLAGQPGTFAPPQIVNPGHPVRDITVVATPQGNWIAALDRGSNTMSLYRHNADGSFSLAGQLQTGAFATRILSGELAGDGGPADDLAVLNSLDGTVSIFLADGHGGFSSATPTAVGLGGSDLELSAEAGGPPDLLVTNQASGDMTVLVNDGHGAFAAQHIYRAAQGPFELDSTGQTVRSFMQTSGVTAGDFNGAGLTDAVAINAGANSLAFLTGQGGGNFLNPAITLLGFKPAFVASGPLRDTNHDGQITATDLPDLVVLDQQHGTVNIYLNDGHGHFTLKQSLSAGNAPSSVTIADINGDGIPDLLVGNSFGDVLVLLGNGDGTFRPFVRADQAVPFATSDAQGDVILANQSVDQVMSQIRQAGTTSFSTGSFNQQGNGLIAPGAVVLADLTNNGRQDLIVANSGSNNILVYMRKADGSFAAPVSYFAGTNPVGVTVQDLGNGHPDIVVANRGSNDVSILFGAGTGTFTYGPRLKGGNGPLGVTVQQQNGTVTGLIVSDSDGTLRSLPSVGNGFFNDTNPLTNSLGGSILQALTGGFVLTQAGIFQVNETTLSATEVFASTTLTAFNTFGNDLTAGFEDGSVALLSEANGKFAEALTFRDAELTDPSALQVTTINGVPEIYATTAGESRIFVFAIPTTDRSQTTTVQPVSDVGVALVATVVTGNSDFIFQPGGDLGFAVGLGETAGANVNALAFLTTLLTGSSGDSVESFAGGGASAEAPTPLNGFISGIEDAMRLFQQRIAGAEASGGAAPRGPTTNPADWRSLVDQAYSGFFQSATAMGEIGQVPTRVGAYSLQALDAAMRPGLKSTDGTGGMEGTGFGLQAVLESIQQALGQTSRAVGRSLEGALLPDRGQVQPPVGPMSANDPSGSQSPTIWAPRLLVADRDGQSLSVTAEPVDWQANLAAAFVLGGFWQSRDRSADKRANLLT
jgi:hypothetical protein